MGQALGSECLYRHRHLHPLRVCTCRTCPGGPPPASGSGDFVPRLGLHAAQVVMNPKSASTLRRCWYLWSRHRPNQSYEGYSWDCEGEGYTIQVAVYTVCVVDAAYRLQVVAGVIRDVLHVGHAFGDHTLKSPILKGVGMPVRLGTFVWDKPLHRVAASLQTQRSRCTACDSVNLDKLRFGLQHYGSSFCRPYHPRRSQQHSFL